MPKVSVIIPNYNYRRYLQERVETVLNQTFQDFEIILLDDCSTDGSQELLREYAKNPKVTHYVENDMNTGSPFKQWQRGLELASGEYVWIAESDDFADCHFLEYTVMALDENTSAAFVATCSQFVDENDKNIDADWDWVPLDGCMSLYPAKKYIRYLLFWDNTVYNASMVLLRKKAYLAADKRFADMRFSGDWMLWIDMLKHGDVIKINRRLSFFRQHNKRVTVTSEKTVERFRESMEINRNIWQDFSTNALLRWCRMGVEYKKVLRDKSCSREQRQRLLYVLNDYGVTSFHYYCERIAKTLSQLLPFMRLRDKNLKTVAKTPLN